jgi:hypothetical protein
MRYRAITAGTLLIVSVVGIATIQLTFSPALPMTGYVLWWLFLVLLPLILAGIVMLGWIWSAMAGVVYGTLGLAIDLSTILALLGEPYESYLKLILSIVSAGANFSLIVLGARASWSALEERQPPQSRPPSPPFLSSS